MLANVIELVDHHRAVFVAGLGDLAEMGDDGIVLVPKIATGQHRGAVGRHRLDHDHGAAAAGALGVIAEVAFDRQAVLGPVGGMGAEVEPVLERLVTQVEGREEVRNFLRHGAGSGGAAVQPRP